MKIFLILATVTGLVFAGIGWSASANFTIRPFDPADAWISEAYAALPISFEPNWGQFDSRVNFLSRRSGYTLFLTPEGGVFSLHKLFSGPIDEEGDHRTANGTVVRLKLVGANPRPRVTGLEKQVGRVNYLIGNDPTQWRSNIPTYAKVIYEDVYPGVSLVYYGDQRQLEFDFIVAPHADTNRIKLDFQGVKNREVDTHGDLVLQTEGGELRLRKPTIYQEVNGIKQKIRGGYILHGVEVGFRVGIYDAGRPLVVDPVLVYSSYLGGSSTNRGTDIAIDPAGNSYVTGETFSTDFPITNALQTVFGGGVTDVFIAKLNATGTARIYSTYLGGRGSDSARSVAVDAAGNAYITGVTNSTNFATSNALRPTHASATDAFVVKLNAVGSALIYSTYLGGSGTDGGSGIAVDAAGNVYVTGSTTSTNFPTANALQPDYGGGIDDVFVTKFSSTGSTLVYSTFLGGSDLDAGHSIAVDTVGNVYVTGVTFSKNFPIARPLQRAHGGGSTDAFVAKLNVAGSALVYSTYLGGNDSDDGFDIAVDGFGNAFVTGETSSSNFPTARPLQSVQGGRPADAFVAKLDATGSAFVYATYLGGSGVDRGKGIAVDAAGNAYVTGVTHSTNFPTANSLHVFRGVADAFVTKLNVAGSVLIYSTYLGGSAGDDGIGIAVDAAGNAYVTGWTWSTNFPMAGPFQPVPGGVLDAFVVKISEIP